ncbi:phosphohydrolase [bacterium]|nr:phosphohydrolase [bacterium]
MSREEAVELVKSNLKNKNLRKHVFAVEAGMRALAPRYDADPDVWGLAGLLHDLDYEETLEDVQRHTYITRGWLESRGDVSEEILDAIHAHVGLVPRKTTIEKAIHCVDPTTGFLVACALMHPEKKLKALDADFILRRFKEKRFAAGADRDQMAACSEIDLELDEFMLMIRDAMISINDVLGL